MSQWPETQLRRLFRVVNGGTPTADPINWDGEVRWATPVDLARVDGEFIDETERRLTVTGLRSGSRSVPSDTLILSTRAPIGYVAQTVRKIAFNQGCRGLVPVVSMDIRYFRYQLSALRDDLQSLGAGSTFQELSTEALATMRLANPDIKTQRAIADFLDAETARIDALIAKKRRMIDLLDERLTVSISKALSNWPQVPLKRKILYREGPGIMAEDFRDEGVPLLRVAGIGGTLATLDGCNFLDPQTVAKRWGRFAVEEGDYLISASASMGTVSRVGPATAGAIPYTGIIRLRPRTSDIDMEYARFFFRSENFMQQIDSMKTGVAIQHYGPTHLDRVSLPVPTLEHQRQIACTLGAEERLANASSQKLRRQIQLLAEHRQALITAAVTGQLEIPGAAIP